MWEVLSKRTERERGKKLCRFTLYANSKVFLANPHTHRQLDFSSYIVTNLVDSYRCDRYFGFITYIAM